MQTWTYLLAGLPKISEHPVVSSLVAASQRILGKPKSKKEPISPEMSKALVKSKISDVSFLIRFENSILCLVGYAGFFPFNELRALRACGIKFFLTISIFLKSSKTDVMGRGLQSREQIKKPVL